MNKINQEDVSLTSLKLNPSVDYTSSSLGVSGSKFVFNERSKTEKVNFDKGNTTFNSSLTELTDNLKQAINAVPNNTTFITSYLNQIAALPEKLKYQQKVEILTFTPLLGSGSNYNKKRSVLSNLYSPYYKPEYPEAHFAYTNYHTLNFFSSSYFNTSSVLIYPNEISLSGSTVISSSYAPLDEFTINFWINPRYDFNDPGTILQISGGFVVSLVTGSSKDINGNVDKFRILFQFESEASKLPNAVVPNGLNSTITTDNSLEKNKWYNITARWGTNAYSQGTGSVLINGSEDTKFILTGSRFEYDIPASSEGPNAVFVGNFLESTNTGNSGVSRFFGADTGEYDGLKVLNLASGFTEPDSYRFKFPLNAEIHDIKIFNKHLTIDEINSIYSNGPVKEDQSLIFYVPPFFTQESPFRTKSGTNGGILKTPYYNASGTTLTPYSTELALYMGSHYINLENHSRELVGGLYPRLFGLTPNLFNTTVTASTGNGVLYLSESVLKRNLMILPNDNGQFVPNYSWLAALSTSLFKNDVSSLDLGYINLRNVVSSSWFGAFLDSSPTSSIGFSLLSPNPSNSSSFTAVPSTVPFILQQTRDPSSNSLRVFDISNIYFGSRIEPGSLTITDSSVYSSDNKISITLKDDGRGNLYRANGLSENSTWNSVGNVFYNEGIVVIKHPSLLWFGESQFRMTFKGNTSVYTMTIDCYANALEQTESANASWNKELKASNLANDTDTQYTLISEVLIHDDNLNVVARANLAQPVLKRTGDSFLFKLPINF